jgi:carboxypeptidase Q
MRKPILTLATGALLAAAPAAAQTFSTDDPVLRGIWQQGMDQSRVYDLAQALLDSVGPRLTGTPQQDAAHDWAVRTYGSWGIEARKEQYGTWTGWRRGVSHIDLMSPRVRTLEGTLLGWSGGTGGRASQGELVVMPVFDNASEVAAWLASVRGKFVAISYPQPTCRPDHMWREYAAAGSFERMDSTRQVNRGAWNNARFLAGPSQRDIHEKLESAGALGIVESNWSNDFGVNKVFRAYTRAIPAVDLSCEDYGLVFRLAERGQGPVLRINADAEFLGDVPTFNTIATIPGRELPDEYVLLSAHFDSWDSSSGATDNGTGTVTMMEAMRILRQVYPNPRRTIVVGHWSGEEQGLNGSRAWAHDHPEVVEGLQALFNQDNGTGRVQTISTSGLVGAGAHFADWLARVPQEISREINLVVPGTPAGGGSDHAAFICYGAPAFSLSSLNWGYGTYTWHTNRDTFDKVVFDDVKMNATLTAMLAYLASEDPDRVSRERRSVMPRTQGGQPAEWPECRDGARQAPG